MLLFLLSLGSSLDKLLLSLISQAQESMQRPKSAPQGQSYYRPGDYEIHGISFTLIHPLLSFDDPSILGYSSGCSTLALIGDPVDPDSTFVDEHQTLIKVGNRFETYQGVSLYNSSVQNPLAVFINLRIRTTKRDSKSLNNAESVKCEDLVGPFIPNICETMRSFQWDPNTDRPYETKITEGLIAWRGAKFSLETSIDWEFKGWRNMGLRFMSSFEGKVGLGFKFDEKVEFETNLSKGWCWDIVGKELKFARFKLGASVQACVDISLSKVIVELPKPLEYYRTWTLTAKRHGQIKTSGVSFPKPETEWAANIESDLNFSDIYEALQKMSVTIVPLVKVYLELGLAIGELVDYSIQVGIGLRLEFKFKGNTRRCLCPYLYGNIALTFFVYAEISPLVIFYCTLLKGWSGEVPIVAGLQTPSRCIFNVGKTKEGHPDLIDRTVEPTYLFSNFKVTYYPAMGSFLGDGMVIPRFEVFRTPNDHAQSLVLPILEYKSKFGKTHEEETKKSQAFMVAVLTKNSILRLSVDGWKDETKTSVRLKDDREELTVSRGRLHTGYSKVYVTYERRKLRPVVPFKEFSVSTHPGGSDGRYICFRPNLPPGVEIRLLIHGLYNEMYRIASDVEVLDEMNPTEKSIGSYVTKTQIRLTILQFKLKDSYRSVSISYCRGTKVLTTKSWTDLKPKQTYTGSQLNLDDFHWDLSEQSPLVVCVTIERKSNSHPQKYEKTFTAKSLSSFPSFEIPSENDDYYLVLHVDGRPRNVVFELKQAITVQERGLFCRVIRIRSYDETSLYLPGNESYGILEFLGIEFGIGDVHIVIKLIDATPLLEGRRLNESCWLIHVKSGASKHNKLRVPFRRESDGEYRQPVQLLVIFSSTPDGLCLDGLKAVPVCGEAVGCIEPVANDKTIFNTWVAFPPIPQGVPLPSQSNMKISGNILDFKTFRVYIFKLKATGTVSIFPEEYTIAEDTAYIVLAMHAITPFVDRRLPFFIRAPKATGVAVYCNTNRQVLEKSKDRPEIFSGILTCNNASQFVALNTNPRYSFRVSEYSIKVPTLFTYKNESGMIHVRGRGQRFQENIMRQIITDLSNGAGYKTWDGVPIEKHLQVPGTITVRARKAPNNIEGKCVELVVFFKGNDSKEELEIPWGIEKYLQDPEKFYKSLGISKVLEPLPNSSMLSETYSGRVVNFTVEGNIVVSRRHLDVNTLKKATITDVLDLRANDVSGNSVFTELNIEESEEEEVDSMAKILYGLDEETLMMIEVAVSAFVGALIISLVLFLVYKIRTNRKSKSLSPLSSQSSSDEIRQEILSETAE